MSKEKEEFTFETWSSMWDKLFTICKMKNNFKALLIHTVGNYNPRWNKRI